MRRRSVLVTSELFHSKIKSFTLSLLKSTSKNIGYSQSMTTLFAFLLASFREKIYQTKTYLKSYLGLCPIDMCKLMDKFVLKTKFQSLYLNDLGI